eukprot:CAMPEP_0113631136 /NCGR_PEP_ID=MMETSP0017_2-20120614/16181_1 /TAXON_ID=2856 /ORGANISM="Cylindrotheca closterium" /LENGTH=565 /DNA_ID=CAMNT_0000541635 /DNA_START=46 /DNA_END=1743 /DNA_ORIENTATION=+ /assembly_acc=CAM_ASM_000147
MSDPPPAKHKRTDEIDEVASAPETTALEQSTEDGEVVFVYTDQTIEKAPTNTTRVIVDPSARRINDQAFRNYEHLRSVSIPATVEEIGNEAFEGCSSLVDVRLHRGLKRVGTSAFAQCSSLVGIEIPMGITAIEESTFGGCSSLRNVRMPTTVETIGENAFCVCSKLERISLHQGIRAIGQGAFSFCKSLLEIEIPHGIHVIRKSTFWWCKSLCSVSIPNTVEIIETNAFYECDSLTDAQLGSGLKRIDEAAFENCKGLSAIALPVSLEVLGTRAFADCTSLLGVELPTEIDIRIESQCFPGCESLVNFCLPDAGVIQLQSHALTGSCLCSDGGYYLPRRHGILRACYESTTTTVEELTRILDSSNILAEWSLKDSCGMTAFHILAMSVSLNPDVLKCLLDRYPMDVLGFKDRYENTMMDYLLKHTSSRAVLLLRTVLQTAVVNTTSTWQRSSLSVLVESIPQSSDMDARRQCTLDFFRHVGYCERVERTSLLELAVWNMKMKNSVKVKETHNDDGVDRESCRLHCGARIVIENVFGFFWEGETRSDTALSLFPLCSPKRFETTL